MTYTFRFRTSDEASAFVAGLRFLCNPSFEFAETTFEKIGKRKFAKVSVHVDEKLEKRLVKRLEKKPWLF